LPCALESICIRIGGGFTVLRGLKFLGEVGLSTVLKLPRQSKC